MKLTRGKSLLFLALVIFSLAGFALVAYPSWSKQLDAPVVVQIPRGSAFPSIAKLLAAKDIIGSPQAFRLYAKSRGLSGKAKAGKYRFEGEITPRLVLETLVAGAPAEDIRVTVREGLHMLEIFAILEANGVSTSADLEKLARDPAFLSEQGITGENVDGYLFPETYRFRPEATAREVLLKMIGKHKQVWNEIAGRRAKEIKRIKEELGWNDYQILTMAAIVEKEAVVDTERPTIAQVFINRITSPSFQPKRLETDPTIRYGCMVPIKKSPGCQKWDPSQRLRRAQLDDEENLYNTYQHEGLPPGPICNPGAKSLEATISPDGSGYFFFVAKNNGTHVFSKTYREHDKNVTKFQK